MNSNRVGCALVVLAGIMTGMVTETASACNPDLTVVLGGRKPEWVHVNCPLSVDATASGGWVSSWRYYVYPGGDCTRCDCRYDLPCGDPPDSNCPGLKFPSVGTYRLYVDVKEMDGSCWNLLDQDTDSKTVYAVRTTISIAYAVLNIGGPRIPATAHVDPAGPITNCRLRIGMGGLLRTSQAGVR